MINRNLDNSLEDLIEKIDHELSIRKRQLSILHEIYSSLSANNHKFTFIRSTVPELYAHYEGFMQFIFSELMSYLEATQIPNRDLRPSYLIFPLLVDLEGNIVKQKSKTNRMLNIFNRIFESNDNLFEITNLEKYQINHDTIKSTFDILGLEDEELLEYDNIDLLYKRRNGIAHGLLKTDNQFAISGYADITEAQVKAACEIWKSDYDCILSCLDAIKEIILNYIFDKKYLVV